MCTETVYTLNNEQVSNRQPVYLKGGATGDTVWRFHAAVSSSCTCSLLQCTTVCIATVPRNKLSVPYDCKREFSMFTQCAAVSVVVSACTYTSDFGHEAA
jgi:hypothetical protein